MPYNSTSVIGVYEEGYSYRIVVDYGSNDQSLFIPIRKHDVTDIDSDPKWKLRDLKNISLVKFVTEDKKQSTIEGTTLATGEFAIPDPNWTDLSKSNRINLFIYQFHNRAVTPKLFITYD